MTDEKLKQVRLWQKETHKLIDEEIEKQNGFEKWYYKKYPVTLNIGEEYRLEQMNDCFNAGAKWGMEHAIEWHDLRKDPNDLPKENGEYWCKLENGHYDFRIYYLDSLFYKSHWEELGIIAWCELPKFEE